jgi:hypothetical protein
VSILCASISTAKWKAAQSNERRRTKGHALAACRCELLAAEPCTSEFQRLALVAVERAIKEVGRELRVPGYLNRKTEV